MATTFSPNLLLGKPAVADRNWNLPLNENVDILDAISPLAGLAVTPTEMPSASLNIKIAAGSYRRGNGQIGTYSGTTSHAIAASSTKVLYLDGSSALQVASSYPATVHVRLATVVTGTGSITSITDNRIAAVEILGAFASAANDSAAATAGVPVGGMYQDGTGIVRVRLT